MKVSIYIFIILILSSCSKKEQVIKVNSKNSGTDFKDSVEVDTSLVEGKTIKLDKVYKFEDYKTERFQGKLAEPNFTGNEFADDQEYVDFIQSGCKRNGINFAGHFTIIERSCGALCGHIFIVDRISGKIFVDIKPKDGKYGYEYRNDSEMLIANSEVFTRDDFTEYNDFFGKPEFYVWKQNDFVRID